MNIKNSNINLNSLHTSDMRLGVSEEAYSNVELK